MHAPRVAFSPARAFACSQVAQVADAVPLMYAGFLAFFLGLATFFVRAPAAPLAASRRHACRLCAHFFTPSLSAPVC
jgi:hypothetical protein